MTLGAAWAAPPAMHQPTVCETPYAALCHPAGRGDGRIADDIYALGVLLVTLALGRMPMEGLDDKAILHRKLEIGDFAAVTGGERLSPMLSDLVRGMLAEDPEHRPSPALLRDPAGARGRRVAARPPSKAPRPFRLGATTVWNNRTLALAMALEPAEALTVIQTGTLMYWLRRGLGDSGLAVKLEDLVRHLAVDLSADKEPSGARMVMQAICDADLLMPLCWRGLVVFPDGIGSLLAAAAVENAAFPARAGAATVGDETDLGLKIQEIVATEAQGVWAGAREERVPSAPQRLEARQRRAIFQIRGPAGGLPRLAYTLNPLIPCASPLLEGQWISSVAELAPALDVIAREHRNAELLDPHIAAFIGARSERWLDAEVKSLTNDGDEAVRILAILRLFAEMQARYHPAPLTGLTNWVAARARPLVERWKNRDRRAELEEQLKALTALGFVGPILTLLEDHEAQAADSEGLTMALADLARLDAELRGISEGGDRRLALSARLGREIAAAVGLTAVAASLLLAAMG